MLGTITVNCFYMAGCMAPCSIPVVALIARPLGFRPDPRVITFQYAAGDIVEAVLYCEMSSAQTMHLCIWKDFQVRFPPAGVKKISPSPQKMIVFG